MNDIESAISIAWNEISPKLLADPEELNRRLARRKLKCFARPLRAWCVAIRASDHRITPMDTVIVPRHALSLDAASHPGRYAEHEVTLTKDLLVRLCAAVEIGSPGEPADEVAKRLGCRPYDLIAQRRNGFLRTTPKPGLRGRRGRPVPLIHTPEDLDPQAFGRRAPDEVFGSCWYFVPGMMVDGFTQTITRIPHYKRIRGRDHFVGWRWVCPCCRRNASTLFHPVDQPDFATYIGFAPALAEPSPKPVPIFACNRCHGVIGFGRAQLTASWNLLILRYTGGLLYGHEVPMPQWLTPKRTRKRGRNAKPHPAPRRRQVEQLLLDTDLSSRQIAAQLGVTCGSITSQMWLIWQRRGVRNREELRALLRPPQAAPRAAG